jgi:hypothetical protein
MVKPEIYRYYQHRYGGVYKVIEPTAKNTIDDSIWTVYNHVWPFEKEIFIRPYDEWSDGRFKELSYDNLIELFSKDRKVFQQEISAARANEKDK